MASQNVDYGYFWLWKISKTEKTVVYHSNQSCFEFLWFIDCWFAKYTSKTKPICFAPIRFHFVIVNIPIYRKFLSDSQSLYISWVDLSFINMPTNKNCVDPHSTLLHWLYSHIFPIFMDFRMEILYYTSHDALNGCQLDVNCAN